MKLQGQKPASRLLEDCSGGVSLSYGTPPYDIHLEVNRLGNDILASVTGGTRAHIGAAALAEPAGAVHPVTGQAVPDAKPGVRLSVLTAFGHKDKVLAEMFACVLCEKYGVNVCAAAGVHVDGAGPEEIALMLENAKHLLTLV